MVVPLAHEVHGTGAPWVLLHGFPLNRAMWGPQLALARQARLVLPDLRGFGGSPPAASTRMLSMAEDVLALCDQLGLGQVGVVGFSLGGYVALELQALAPERVRALALVSTQARADTAQAKEGREALARRVEAEGAEVLVREFVPKLLSEAGRRDAALGARLETMTRANPPEGLAAALRAMAGRRDHLARLPEVACPALVVAAEADQLIPLDRGREMAGALPHAELVEVPEAGHACGLERPGEVNRALARFMAPLAGQLAR